VLRIPGEHVQLDVAIGTPFGKLRRYRVIDMDLSDHRRERGEIVRVIAADPRKPITARHVTGTADAERRPAIVEGICETVQKR
jgi:hypothetical protein